MSHVSVDNTDAWYRVYVLYLFHVHHREKMIGLHCSKNEPYKPKNK